MNFVARIFCCLLVATATATTVTANLQDFEAPDNFDYIVRLIYDINHENVPIYLLNSYLNNFEKNISTEDIIVLCRFENYTPDDYTQLLSKINISSEVFSVEGLDKILNITRLPFRIFYSNVLINLNQRHTMNERNALLSLGISTGAFSDAMEFGTDAETFSIFRLGNFSKQSLTNASQLLQTTVDNLFATVNHVILNQTKQLDRYYVRTIFQENGWDNLKVSQLSMALNLSSDDVNKIANLKNVIDSAVSTINKNVTMGVVTNENVITVNREIYNVLRNEENIIKIQALSIANKTIVHEIINKSEAKINYVDLILKWNSTTYINVAENNSAALINCSYVTLSPNLSELSVQDGNSAKRERDIIVMPRNNSSTSFILGSPIVCRRRLYGMANGTNVSHIFFNPIYGFIGHPVITPLPHPHPHPAHGGTISTQSFPYFLAVITNLVVFVLLEYF